MNDQKIQDIKDALREVIQQLVQRGQPISQQLKQMLTQVMEHAATRITQLRQEATQQPESTPEVSLQQQTPQGADLLWILSGGRANAFVNYLRTYPGQGFKELLNNPPHLAQVIAQFQKVNPAEEPKIGDDGIPDTQFPSSNVSGMKYDKDTGKLLVRFHGNNGEPVYQYDGVPPQIFQLLQHGNAFAKTRGKNKWGEWWQMKNPSIGASVNQYLKKGGYNYTRLK